MRVEVGPPEELEDPLLHPLRDDVLEPLRLVVHLIPGIAEDLDQEHLQQSVMADQLEGDPPALLRQLLSPIAVVHNEAVLDEAPDHLADRRGGDAQALRELAGRHRSAIAVKVVKGLEVVLLGPGRDDLDVMLSDHRVLGAPSIVPQESLMK